MEFSLLHLVLVTPKWAVGRTFPVLVMSGWRIRYYNTKQSQAWVCGSVLLLKFLPPAASPPCRLSVGTQRPQMWPALREEPCHQLIHATAEMSDLLETFFWTAESPSTKAPASYCLHWDTFNITSNSKKFYPCIDKIHGGTITLSLLYFILGCLCSQRQLLAITVLPCHPTNSKQ